MPDVVPTAADPSIQRAALLGRSVAARARAIGDVAPFADWPAAALNRLARRARVMQFDTGAMLVTRGSPMQHLLVIVQGRVVSSAVSDAGRRFVYRLASPPQAYGLLPLIDGGGLPNDLAAAEPTTALAVPLDALRAELARAPVLWAEVAREAAARSRENIERINRLVFMSLPARTADLLLRLAQSRGQPTEAPITLPVRVSQESLGEMLGVSRQTIATLLRGMATAGLIRWRYGRAVLLDPRRLQTLARGCLDAWP